MNYLKLFLLSIILIGCKKKTFADDIVLTNNSKEALTDDHLKEFIDSLVKVDQEGRHTIIGLHKDTAKLLSLALIRIMDDPD